MQALFCDAAVVVLQYVAVHLGHKRRKFKDTNPLLSSLLAIFVWCSNFVGSESSQKQSVKLLQNMVYSTIQHPPTPPHSHTHCLYILYI
jgi:hypothetical protein